MLAPMFGSFLVSLSGWRMPFVATAVAGALVLYGIRTSLRETHVPQAQPNAMRQLYASFREFISHRQSRFGALLIVTTITGIMSLISGSAALVIEIYGYPVEYFGFIFAMTGAAILTGSAINRYLLQRYDALQMIGIGAALAGVVGVQFLFIAWLGQAGFWWIWGNACLFMCATAFLLPNATALALDPVPEIAGVASSLIGTIQSVAGASSAIVSSMFYTGTILNVAVVLGLSGVTSALLFVFRKRILGAAPLPGGAG